MSRHEWIDVTLDIKSGMLHWPGDPPVILERVHDMRQGDEVNLSRITMGVHSGTHVDAPVHFIKEGTGIDVIPIETLVGPARVLEMTARAGIAAKDLAGQGVAKGERILLKTGNSAERLLHMDAFTEEFVHLSESGAKYLVSAGVKVVGIDYLSIGGYKIDGRTVHRMLLAAGIAVIEGLDLSNVAPGHYDMVCLPMKISGSDGAPARVILRKRQRDPSARAEGVYHPRLNSRRGGEKDEDLKKKRTGQKSQRSGKEVLAADAVR
jgi:arylformamidase